MDSSVKRVLRLTAVALLVLGARPAAAQEMMAPPADEAARAGHLLRRATFGPRPEDMDRVVSMGRAAWLERQLHPDRIADDLVDARLVPLNSTRMPMAELYEQFLPPQQLQRQLMQQMDPAMAGRRPDSMPPRNQLPPEIRMQLQQRSPQRLLADFVNAKLIRSVHTERQLEEVMTDFWFNHFNVFFGKNNARYMVADYEREAIRPHVFGKFEDMLMATAKHPAMLFYLDNWTSVAPDSMRAFDPQQAQLAGRIGSLTPQQRDQLVRTGRITRGQLEQLERMQMNGTLQQQRGRGRGLNENYARELMELHTLGVDGGYTQQDVIEVARALTGWSFVPLQQGQRGRAGQRQGRPARGRGGRGAILPVFRQPQPGEFVFNELAHDRGEKVILGQKFPGRGIREGETVIRMLAHHPSTAHFLATKLVERFVSDTPDPAFVEELAQVFLETDGDLREVTRTLFSSESFFEPAVIGAKVKTPFELVVSSLRATRAEFAGSRRIMETLRSMGHLPYNEPAPTGFPASSEDWVNSGAMLARMNFALDLAGGRVDGVRVDPARLTGSANLRAQPATALTDALAALMPGIDTRKLEEVIRADAAAQTDNAAPRARFARATGLALGSPEFQKR
jgi:uncharacterized protein (DUF1800 family)